MNNMPMPTEPMDAAPAEEMPQGDITANDAPNEMPSDFDTNFDAGVEADEDEDPKKYIQQLTGKLSQTLNNFNNEGEPDEGLCKYVANMIVTQASKWLDEKDKKDIIKKINSTDSELEGGDDEEDFEDDMAEEEPMNERILTKKDIAILSETLNNLLDPEEKADKDIKPNRKKATPFMPKKFN